MSNNIKELCSEIGKLGQQMTQLGQQYDGMFKKFYDALDEMVKQNPDLSQAALQAANATDNLVGTIHDKFPNQPKYECAKGCVACCHLMVKMPPGFADLIANYVKQHFSDEELTKLIEDLKTTAKKEQAANGNSDVFRNRCPMLGEDNVCRIYEVRPLTCRLFNSTSVKKCQAVAFDFDNSGVTQDAGKVRLYTIATFVLEQQAKALGLEGEQELLSTGVLKALEKLD